MGYSIDYVGYASWRFITGYVESEGRRPTKTLFDRFMTSLHRDLKEGHGTDIGLPHCWYEHGDEAVINEMPYLQCDYMGSGESRVSYRGCVPEVDRTDAIVGLIDESADSFVSRCSEEGEAEVAVDGMYASVPFEFQVRFGMLRESLRTSGSDPVAADRTETVRTLFEDAMGCFPAEEFPEASPHAERFGAVFRAALDSGATAAVLQDIAECFWSYFCHHLRLHGRCHENVSVVTLGAWVEAILAETVDYERTIQNQAHMVDPEGSSGEVVRGLLRERERRIKEVGELMEGMDWDGPESSA